MFYIIIFFDNLTLYPAHVGYSVKLSKKISKVARERLVLVQIMEVLRAVSIIFGYLYD